MGLYYGMLRRSPKTMTFGVELEKLVHSRCQRAVKKANVAKL